MARRTKALSGEGARRYFRALFDAELSRDPDTAARLTATCTAEIAEMRVRLPLVTRRHAPTPTAAAAAPETMEPETTGSESTAFNVEPSSEGLEQPSPPVDLAIAPSVDPVSEPPVPAPPAAMIAAPTQPEPTPYAEPQPSEPAPTDPGPTPTASFDPYAFSLIVTLRREGRDGLRERLKAIGDLAYLRQIARAQHVGLAATDADADIDTVCEDILSGTERRIAHREAAAS